MAHSVGIGFSQHDDNITAAQQALETAKKNYNLNHIDIAFFFHTSHYEPKDIAHTLYDELDKTQLIGSATAGIFFADRIEHRGLAVMIIGSDYIRFQSDCASHLKLQSLSVAGRNLAKQASLNLPPSQRKLFMLFFDGVTKDISSLISGTKTFFEPAFPVIGAGSCDNFQFENTQLSYNDKTYSDCAAGVLLAGEFKYGVSCLHGFRPLGKPRNIDEVTGNIINKIDQQKAFHIFKEYFEEDADQIKKGILSYINLRYPLGIYTAEKQEYLLRNVIDVLDDDSIVCQDSVLKDKDIHIMSGSVESYLQATLAAAKSVKKQLEGKTASFILVFESLTRQRLLGNAAEQEIQLIQNEFGDNVPIIGMYSYGEIFTSTVEDNFGQTYSQNGSILILAIS